MPPFFRFKRAGSRFYMGPARHHSRQSPLRYRIHSLHKRLWGDSDSGPGTPLAVILRIALLTVRASHRNNLAILASGLSFYLMLSVVPFLAYLMLLLRAFRVSDWLQGQILTFVAGGNADLVPTIEQYVHNAESGMVGGLGTAFTFVLGFVLLQRVKATLNVIWQVNDSPGYGHRLVEYLAVLVIAPLMLAGALAVTAFFASEEVRSFLPFWVMRGAPSQFMATVSGFVALTAITFYAYLFLPDSRVGWRAALVGALAGATGLMLVQRFSVVLILVVSRQSPIYGALALLPFMMLWFYAAWMIFLGGAQLSFQVRYYTRELEARRMALGL